ncbi:hypothetical protein [Donghicola mangrovi]|nr:hypothetical protein [Donghicola mangrovi]
MTTELFNKNGTSEGARPIKNRYEASVIGAGKCANLVNVVAK